MGIEDQFWPGMLKFLSIKKYANKIVRNKIRVKHQNTSVSHLIFSYFKANKSSDKAKAVAMYFILIGFFCQSVWREENVNAFVALTLTPIQGGLCNELTHSQT